MIYIHQPSGYYFYLQVLSVIRYRFTMTMQYDVILMRLDQYSNNTCRVADTKLQVTARYYVMIFILRVKAL